MKSHPLTRDEVLRCLSDAEPAIRRLGVRRIALFGSVLRGEARPDSDVDLLVEFDPAQKTFEHFMELGFLLEELLQHRVEIVTPESLSPYLGPHILREAQEVLHAA
jgi:predicted nucleotidyltransferase